jgi:ABC-2 type transport system permease protein
MSNLRMVTINEVRLFFREPGTWIVGLFLPTIILIGIGVLFAPHTPDPTTGQRFIDVFAPSMVVITLATLGANTLPARLVRYRERGVLRRLSTTPARPSTLLIAQLIINVVVAIAAVILLIIVGALAFQIPAPQDWIGFAAAFMLGMSSLYALGLLIAAVAPSSGVAAAMIVPLFIAVMFLGGVYVPRQFLPDVIQRLGEYTPPGVQAMLDAWLGTAPQLVPLGIMAAITVIAGLTAARIFRWE